MATSSIGSAVHDAFEHLDVAAAVDQNAAFIARDRIAGREGTGERGLISLLGELQVAAGTFHLAGEAGSEIGGRAGGSVEGILVEDNLVHVGIVAGAKQTTMKNG
ncbi:MAG: hypothetical protein KDC98_05120 [Planctomycetes bacterium]|nr:hypothetical protein [Planctomycetota bacterium]